MSSKKHHLWQELNQFIDSALHEILFLPVNCFHFIHHACQKTNIRPKIQTQSNPTLESEPDAEARTVISSQAAFIIAATKSCPGCGEDLITRAHSREATKYSRASNVSFHDWMSNDTDRMVPYGDTPHPSGFEQNVAGLKDEHLQRVEQYWFDHQLQTPTSCPKCRPPCCANVEAWHLSQAKPVKDDC